MVIYFKTILKITFKNEDWDAFHSQWNTMKGFEEPQNRAVSRIPMGSCLIMCRDEVEEL